MLDLICHMFVKCHCHGLAVPSAQTIATMHCKIAATQYSHSFVRAAFNTARGCTHSREAFENYAGNSPGNQQGVMGYMH